MRFIDLDSTASALGKGQVKRLRLRRPLALQSAGVPVLSFGDDDTGFFQSADDVFEISTAGVSRFKIEADGTVTVAGNFVVSGTTTTVNSTTLTVDDKNIELGSVDTPSDTTADGGGITLKGATDKTITWVDADDAWSFNQGIKITGGTFGLDVNSSSHAYVRLDSSAAATAAWLQYNQGGTSRWLAGIEGNETDWQLYDSAAGAKRLAVTQAGAVNISTGSVRTAAEGQGFEGEGGFGGVKFATQSWTSASAKTVATFNMGAHQAAVCRMICCHSDWSNHSGGGRIVKVIFTSGYGSPGSIVQDSYTPSHFGDIAFSIGTSGNTRYLQVTNNAASPYDGYGPGTVRIVMTAVSTSSWSLATS